MFDCPPLPWRLNFGWESAVGALIVPLLDPGVGADRVEVAIEELAWLVLLPLHKQIGTFYVRYRYSTYPAYFTQGPDPDTAKQNLNTGSGSGSCL